MKKHKKPPAEKAWSKTKKLKWRTQGGAVDKTVWKREKHG